MNEHEDIPAFLKLSAEERAAAWKGRHLTTMRKEMIDTTVKKRQRQTTKGMKEHYAALIKKKGR